MNATKTTDTLLADVRRYRFARMDLLLRNVPESEQRRMLQRIHQSREVQVIRLPCGTAVVALARKKSASISSIARGIALHSFCCDGIRHRSLLLPDEVNKYFPRLFRNGMPAGYYVDTSGERPVFGLIKVDVGLDHISRILQHSSELIERHSRAPGFSTMASSGQLEITYIVPTETKAAAINFARCHSSGHQSNCRAVVVPLLLDILAPLNIQSTFPDVVGL